MRSYKADIFSQGINDLMYKGSLASSYKILLKNYLLQAEIGIANWLDFIAIKTRLPNFYGPEQARVDGISIKLYAVNTKTTVKTFAEHENVGSRKRSDIQEIAEE